MDIAAGLAAAGQAIGIAKGLREVDEAFDQVALKAQIIDLMDKLQDVRGALQDARDREADLLAEVKALQEAAQQRADSVFYEGFRFKESTLNPGKPQGTPYCSRCDQVEGRLIHTVWMPGKGPICPQCKTEFGMRTHVSGWDD